MIILALIDIKTIFCSPTLQIYQKEKAEVMISYASFFLSKVSKRAMQSMFDLKSPKTTNNRNIVLRTMLNLH